MFKSANSTAAATLGRQTNALLALSLRSFTLRLKITDTFDGEPVVSFRPAAVVAKTHSLTPRERKAQELTRLQWDMEEKKKRERHAVKYHLPITGFLSRDEIFPAIIEARLTLVHPLCNEFKYGELGDTDFVLGERDTRTIDEIRDAIHEFKLQEGSQSSSQGAQNREKLRSATKQDWQSSRMKCFVDTVTTHLKERLGKILVFSEFLSVLDVAENALLANGLPCLRYDATMDKVERQHSLDKFRKPNGYKVCLMTSRCGGLGLNLTEADGVILLTPSWNPHLEDQCIGRANRTLQEKTVYVYVFHAEDSIERRIDYIQRQKRNKSSKLLDPDEETLAKIKEVSEWSEDKFEEMVSRLTLAQSIS